MRPSVLSPFIHELLDNVRRITWSSGMWWPNNPPFVTRMAMRILLSIEATVCHFFLVPVPTNSVLYGTTGQQLKFAVRMGLCRTNTISYK